MSTTAIAVNENVTNKITQTTLCRKAWKTALHIIGQSFTKRYVNSSHQGTIYETFSTDAEECFERVRKWNIKLCVITITIVAALLVILRIPQLVYLAFDAGDARLFSFYSCIQSIGIIKIFIVFTGAICLMTKFKKIRQPGDATKMVATEWRQMRRLICSSNLAKMLAIQVQEYKLVKADDVVVTAFMMSPSSNELQLLLTTAIEELGNTIKLKKDRAMRDGTCIERRKINRDQKKYCTIKSGLWLIEVKKSAALSTP